MGGSRSADACYAGRNRSLSSCGTSPPNGQREQAGAEGARLNVEYHANSWHETLQQFPSLLRLYPLATFSEAEAPDELEELPAGEKKEEADARAANGGDAEMEDLSATGSAATAPRSEALASPYARNGHKQPAWDFREPAPAEGFQSAPRTPARGYPGQQQQHKTPRSVPSQRGSRGQYDQWSGARGAPSEYYTPDVDGWEQLERARWDIAQREKDVAQREAGVARAEARNEAASRQLAELRQRLEEYGRELEDGIAALTAQQSAVREERRQAAEMQVRARRMCAGAVRDEVVASRMRSWGSRQTQEYETYGMAP